MAKKIIVKISDNPETGTPRVVVFDGIQYLSYSMESAELVWLEYPAKLNLNNQWRPMTRDIIVPRRIVTPISNANKVNLQGITLTEAYIKSVNLILPEETQEDYKIRIDGILADELALGMPEFDFWIDAVNWDNIIEQGGVMLETLKRFDRV